MKQNYKRKLLAGILSVCMMFQTAGTVPAYAVGNAADSGLPTGTSSVCTHHVHDEKCGYTEGAPCTHVHTDECSAEVTKCVHEHTAECYPVQDSGEATGSEAKEPTACTHICDEKSGCITKELACKHVHDDKCGYKESKPCTFDTATCESCYPKDSGIIANAITAFAPLAQSEYTLPVGADEATIAGVLVLPQTVKATVNETEIELAVTWESDKALSTEKADTFTYMAKLTDEGYTLAEGVSLPTIMVAVEEVMAMTLAELTNAEAAVTDGTKVTPYATLSGAIAAAQESAGCTVTLVRDVETTKMIEWMKSTGTIDLNGKTWTGNLKDDGALGVGGSAAVTIKDSVGTGVMTSSPVGATICVDSATLTIEGGTFQRPGWGGISLSVDNSVQGHTSNVTITGGTFSHGIVQNFDLYNDLTSKSLQISGGTFEKIDTMVAMFSGTVAHVLAPGYAYKNTSGWVTDATALKNMVIENVTVNQLPVAIITQPQSVALAVGYTEAPTLSVAATATDANKTIAYQWYKGDTAISGANAATYTVETGLAVGEYAYTCAVTCDGYPLKSDTAIVTVTQSGTTFDGGITVDKADKTYTYGDTITVKATPKATGTAARSLTAPTANQMALFVGSTQISQAVDGANGVYTMTYDTKGKALAFGSNIITAKYVGNESMADYSESVTVTLNKKAITSASVNAGATKVYDGTNSFTGVVLTPNASDILSGDSITATADGTVDANVGETKAFKATSVTLGGAQAGYYSLAASAVSGNVAITKASATGVSQEYPVVNGLAKDYSFDLSKLLPSISSTQEYGSVTYAVASTGNANSVLTAVPTSSDIANGKLTLKVASVATKDQTATVSISITTDNFTVANAVITVKTVDKTPLTISGVAMAERVYNGSAYAYTGTPTFINTTDNKAVAGVSFTTEYEGRNSTNYTKGEAAPTNAGEYNLILTVSGASADTYAGTLTVPFAITQKQVTVKAKDKDILAGAEIPSLANPAVNTDYTTDGFIGKDTLTGTVSMDYTGTPDNTQQGLYTITISGGTVSDNYAVKYESGTLTISIDVSLITAAITAANNAKGGIAIYDTAASSVPNGTKFVTTAEMTTLNTAIQTATAAKATCKTLAQVQAAVKALDDAVANFKAAIKTGTYTAPTTEPTPAPTASPTPVPTTTPTPAPTPKATDGAGDTQDQKPTAGKTTAAAEVDADGKATVTVPEKSITDAITKAQDEAKKNGTEENGISVEIEVTGDENTNSISTTLSEESIKELVDAGVKEVTFKSKMGDITIDLETLQQIQKEQGGDITITVSEADISAFDEKLKEEIGDRPVYELSITRADGTRVTDFDGSITIAIPYTLQEGEDPENIAVVYINENGEKEVMIGSGYDEKTQSAIFTTRHFSTFAIVLMQDKNDAPITDIEQVDKTTQDVGNGTEITDTQGGISTGIMVTIVIAGILAIAMVAVGAYVIVKKRRE